MRIYILLILIFSMFSLSIAQEMIIHLKNGKTIEYSTNDIEKITYSNQSFANITPLPFTVGNWEGAKWCYNNGPSSWFPFVSQSGAEFAIDDYCWGQARTRNYISKNQKISLEIFPKLSSGGTNDDRAYIGFGSDWAAYQGWFVGIVLMNNGEFYFWDTRNGDKQNYIGRYSANKWQYIDIEISSDNILRVKFNSTTSEYHLGSIASSFRFLVSEKDSKDGFIIRNVNFR